MSRKADVEAPFPIQSFGSSRPAQDRGCEKEIESFHRASTCRARHIGTYLDSRQMGEFLYAGRVEASSPTYKQREGRSRGPEGRATAVERVMRQPHAYMALPHPAMGWQSKSSRS